MSTQTLEMPVTTAAEAPPNPFPGLRPFEFDESHLFFGRAEQSEKLLVSLSRVRFVAVVGTSGSGKSSLVRAGLLPALYSGLIRNAGSEWRVAVMRPGRAPLNSLATALNEAGLFDSENSDDRGIRTALTEAVLRRGRLGLVEAVRQAKMPEDENLLIVVDQFEELFRVAQFAADSEYENESAAFVKLLLAAKEQKELPIYVVITMRSDYLGECAQFRDLPEAINEGQYLIPRMTRGELREVITGPVAAVGGAGLTPRLVNQLVNETQDKPNHLPILQHALMRTWELAHSKSPDGQLLDITHYEEVGGMEAALWQHADEAYEELDERGRQIAEKLFKCLTEKGPEDQEVRRPAPLREICEVAKAPGEGVIKVIDVFRARGRSFLMPPEGTPLTADSMIDISHESLIGGWGRLRQWVEEEAQSARVYRRLGEQAALYKEGKAGLYDELDVKLAVEWREQWKPDQVWAARYRYDFADAMRFLKTCERKIATKINRLRIVAAVFCALFLMTGFFALYVLRAKTLLEFYQYKDYHHLANSALDEAGKNNFPKANSLLGSINLDESKNIRHFEWKYLWRSLHHELATLAHQPYTVPSVFFAAGGDRMAAADTGGNVVRWDVSKEPARLQLKGYTAPIYAVAFSPDGKHVVTGHADGNLVLWAEDGQIVATLSRFPQQANDAGTHGLKVQPKPWGVSSIAFSHDGATLAAEHADGIVQVWKVGTQEAIRYMEPCSSKEGFCWQDGKKEELVLDSQQPARIVVGFSPDGKYIATGHARGKVLLWDSGGQIVREVDPGWGPRDDASSSGSRDILSIAFSPKGESLAAGRAIGFVDVWPVAQSMPEARRRLGARFSNASVAQEQSAAARDGGDDKESQETDSRRAAENKHSSSVTAIVFLDEDRVASGSSDGTVKLWNLRSKEGSEFVASRKGHSGGILSLAYSPGRNRLATGSDDKTVKLWDAGAGDPPSVLPESKIALSVALPARGGDLMATVDAEGNIALWNTEEGRKLEHPWFEGAQPEELNNIVNKIESVALSPDGALLASGWGDGAVKVWRTGTGELVNVIDAPPAGYSASTVISLSFISDDGARLATVNSVGTVKVWGTETRNGKLLSEGSFNESRHRNEPRRYSAAFSPDGTTLAVGMIGEESEVQLLDVSTLKPKGTLKGSEGAKMYLSLAFSDDGRRLVGSLDRTVKMWPVNTTWTETIVNRLPDGLVWWLGIGNQREPLNLMTSTKSHIISVAFNQRMLAIAPASGGIELLRAAEDGKINEQQLKER